MASCLEIDGAIVPNYEATFRTIEEGEVVTGHVVRIDKDEVLVDIGYKSEGVIPANELSIRKSVDPKDEVHLGEEVDAIVMTKEDQDGRLIMSKKRARFEKAWRRIETAAESGEPVEGTVIEVVKGGLIIDLGVRGFLPASLVDIRRVPNLDEYMGTKIETKVIELNRSRNNVVLSRRAVLEEERKEVRQQILDRLQPGLVVEGQISNIVDFGAFVDLDGIDGLIHISELSWSHVNHPSGDPHDRRHGQGQGARHRPRPPAHLTGPQADPGGPVAADRRHVQRRRRARGQGHEGRHVRRVRGDPRRRRGARAHLRARAASRREPARDRAPGRRDPREDPRDRLRAPSPVAVCQARRGPDPSRFAPRRARRAGRRGAGRERRPPRLPTPRQRLPSRPQLRRSPRRRRQPPRRPPRRRRPSPPMEAAPDVADEPAAAEPETTVEDAQAAAADDGDASPAQAEQPVAEAGTTDEDAVPASEPAQD